MRRTKAWCAQGLVWFVAIVATATAQGDHGVKKEAEETALASVEDVYRDYRPSFLQVGIHRGVSEAERDISAESTFFTLTLMSESDRVYALVKAAVENERKGDFRLAMEMYQQVIDHYPDALFRVSPFGIFLPAVRYCQLRMLRFPKAYLDLYRTKYDAAAREAFELAQRRHSLEGLAYIRDTMLCTSYGARAMLLLGDAALDGGRYLEALEYYTTVRDYFPDPWVRTPELKLKIALCRRRLGEKDAPADRAVKFEGESRLTPEHRKIFTQVVKETPLATAEFVPQRASAPHESMDDYAWFPPTDDPLGLKNPVWAQALGGSWLATVQPVATRDSLIYRHRNIVYSRSLLNGELRWQFDDGGRRNMPGLDDVVVGNGIVYAPLFRMGINLAAIDEVTGALRWSYGPMGATTDEERMMSLAATPALGGANVFAGYVLNNIRGVTHVDSEYGLMAFDAETGRIRWRTPLCRLRPGRDSFAMMGRGGGRNLIRSYTSPPLYHEGTVYYTTNAGAMAALDALSGQIKWIMRYPYHIALHDATRGWGGGTLWHNQRPLVIGDGLYVVPVNAEALFKLDRRTGRVLWTRRRSDTAIARSRQMQAFFAGLAPTGHLIEAYSFRHGHRGHEATRDQRGVILVNPETGATVWNKEDPIAWQNEPPMLAWGWGHDGSMYTIQPSVSTMDVNNHTYQMASRPFMSADGTLIVTQYGPRRYCHYYDADHLAVFDLNEKKVVARRLNIRSFALAVANRMIQADAPALIKRIRDLPNLGEKDKEILKKLETVAASEAPRNEHPPFAPFGRMTFHRHSRQFEVRASGGRLDVLYDVERVREAVAAGKTPAALLGQAELAVRDRLDANAARLIEKALAAASPDDTAFRTMANQQLYRVHKRLAQGRIQALDGPGEIRHVLGMSRSATSLDDEVEVWFAMADAQERHGQWAAAATSLQTLIGRYGAREHGVPALAVVPKENVDATIRGVVARTSHMVQGIPQTAMLRRMVGLTPQAMPLYTGTLSPLARDLQVRSGEWATASLLRLRKRSPEFAVQLDAQAKTAMADRPGADTATLLPVYPGTPTAQDLLVKRLAERWRRQRASDVPLEEAAAARRELWELADTARISGLTVPDEFARYLLAPAASAPHLAPALPLVVRSNDMAEARETAWKILDHEGPWDPALQARPLFLGGRVRKRTDTQFVLYCVDADSGQVRWKASEQRGETRFEEIRLASDGAEPGFEQVFLRNDVVVTHGLFDVLAFGLADGRLKWRYAVPSGFEILSVQRSGDVLILTGAAETLALYLGTADPRGELIWQEQEVGAPYAPSYLSGDRWVSVREMPYSVTVRYRGTGKLIGRLAVPDLLMNEAHPVIDTAPRAKPIAHDAQRLALYSGDYVLMVDVADMRILWKRGLGEAYTPLRLALGGDKLAVTKKEYDRVALYMLSSDDGRALWQTDPKTGAPAALYHMRIRQGNLYGLAPHPGQAFVFTGLDGAKGRPLFAANTQEGYAERPRARLCPELYENSWLVEVKDRQDFELKSFDLKSGKLLHTVKVKATGDFGEYGRASATMRHGRMALLGGNTLMLAAPKGE